MEMEGGHEPAPEEAKVASATQLISIIGRSFQRVYSTALTMGSLLLLPIVDGTSQEKRRWRITNGPPCRRLFHLATCLLGVVQFAAHHDDSLGGCRDQENGKPRYDSRAPHGRG